MNRLGDQLWGFWQVTLSKLLILLAPWSLIRLFCRLKEPGDMKPLTQFLTQSDHLAEWLVVIVGSIRITKNREFMVNYI